MTDSAPRLLELLQQAGHMVALTGAGISTRAGIPDFRGPQGLYRQPGAERIFTFFGEALPEAALAAAVAQARRADLMLVLGTSLTVHPAAALPEQTLRAGGQLVIVNAQPTPLDHRARLRLSDLADFAKSVGEWLTSYDQIAPRFPS